MKREPGSHELAIIDDKGQVHPVAFVSLELNHGDFEEEGTPGSPYRIASSVDDDVVMEDVRIVLRQLLGIV